MKLRKGDKIKVTAGKDRGKGGVVERVWPKTNKVSVAGVNIFKRHLKPRGQGQKGGIIDVPRPMPESNVALICPKCQQATRVGYKLTTKEKVRVCRKCGAEI